jgi:hypothetical protein
MEREESNIRTKMRKKRRGLHKTKKRRKQARQERKEWNGNEGKSVVGILSISQHFVFDPVRRGCKGFGLGLCFLVLLVFFPKDILDFVKKKERH